MTTDDTRPTLLSRVRDPSDALSWREFDERYRDLILRYARRRGLQPASAEDVRQLVMLGLGRLDDMRELLEEGLELVFGP